jgi:hypothetical protein
MPESITAKTIPLPVAPKRFRARSDRMVLAERYMARPELLYYTTGTMRSGDYLRPSPYIAFAAVLGLCSPVPAVSQPADACNAALLQGNLEFQYRRLPDRCEGRYALKTSPGTTVLRLISLTTELADEPPRANAALALRWNPPADAKAFFIRAESLTLTTAYRMDTLRPEGERLWNWPQAIRAAAQLPKDSLGFIGWFSHSSGREIFVPVAIRQTPDRPPSCCSMALMPANPLQSIELRIDKVDLSTGSSTPVPHPNPFGGSSYPGLQPIRKTIKLPGPGYYRVSLATKTDTGTTVKPEFFVFYASN